MRPLSPLGLRTPYELGPGRPVRPKTAGPSPAPAPSGPIDLNHPAGYPSYSQSDASSHANVTDHAKLCQELVTLCTSSRNSTHHSKVVTHKQQARSSQSCRMFVQQTMESRARASSISVLSEKFRPFQPRSRRHRLVRCLFGLLVQVPAVLLVQCGEKRGNVDSGLGKKRIFTRKQRRQH